MRVLLNQWTGGVNMTRGDTTTSLVRGTSTRGAVGNKKWQQLQLRNNQQK